MIEPSPALADLQMKWPDLHDLDRAKAVHAIKRTGISIRKIAQQLKVSEALLRHLLQALQALPDDQILARDGKISTKELVRRAKSAIIGEARRDLAKAEQSKRLPRDAAPAKMPVSQIIQSCRPAEQKSDEISFVAWFAQ